MSITTPKGFRASGVRCGIKQNDKPDLALIVSSSPAACAGVFTQNRVRASSVDYSSQVVAGGKMQAIVVNSGCANCCTGEQGEADTRRMAEIAGQQLEIDPSLVAVASTGVIGVPLPMDEVEMGIIDACVALGEENGHLHAAEAILTTDTTVKAAGRACGTKEHAAYVAGIAKGSGMIAPNMATMLAFLTTDVDISPQLLQKSLRLAVDQSFNCLTVDGDTSTNDMVLIMANGMSGVKIESEDDPEYDYFYFALVDLCVTLAKKIARDGEGASKLVEVCVRDAETYEDALKVAKVIAESPLVKTALNGNDPNWGRILAAAGRSGVRFDPNKVILDIAGTLVFSHGQPTDFDEKIVSSALNMEEVTIYLHLKTGHASAQVWTCDLSEEYIRINAHYRS